MNDLPDIKWTDEALAQSPALGAFVEVLVQVPPEDRRALVAELTARLEAGLEAKIIAERRNAHL